MIAIKVFGSIMLFLSGFLAHLLMSENWSTQQQAILIAPLLMSLYLGLSAIFTSNTKNFKEYIFRALYIPF